MNRGFSLLELSIVLVIIGLIAGGIVAGASMIRAAELRSVITEQQQFSIAINTFRDKYFAIPGDMKNATAFWGDNATACADAAVADGTPGTCNGDGNNIISQASAANGTGEEFQFWHQLSLAGLISGTYTGLAGPDATDDLNVGENVPQPKLSGSYWRARNFGDATSPITGTVTSAFGLQYGNIIETGQLSGTPFTPQEIWNLDKKLDDGKPAQGKLIARPWNSDCTLAADRDDFAADYALDVDSQECMAIFRNAF